MVQTVCDMMPYLENMTADISIRTDFPSVPVRILANRTLLESLVTNLAVNALRHNRPGGDMTIAVTPDSLAVSNTSDGHPLDSTHIFNRFWKPSENAGGNGLGLAIVMASLVNGLKYSVWEMRPDRSGRNSFPSGHTATAFMTAAMFSREYGERSVWNSVGAYSVAATIGLMRIFNDKHWLGDVLAGAGIGILSAEMGYWLADLIFKENGIRHFPADEEFSEPWRPSFMGLYLGMNMVLGNRMPDSRRGFSPGSVAGVEGAWFFSPYM